VTVGMEQDVKEVKMYSDFKSPYAFLAFDPALARSFGRLGRPALDRRDRGAAGEVDQPVERVLAIARLGAVALRDDDENAVAGEPRAGEPLEPRPHLGRQ